MVEWIQGLDSETVPSGSLCVRVWVFVDVWVCVGVYGCGCVGVSLLQPQISKNNTAAIFSPCGLSHQTQRNEAREPRHVEEV